MKLLLIPLLLPVTIAAQTVEPVLSKDYLDRINNGRSRIFYTDTTNSAKNAFFKLTNSYNGYPIQKIRINNGYLKIQQAYPKSLFLAGNFSSVVTIKTINNVPDLQDQYVQGRSQNGTLVWRGAETNEQFSYGPSINSLEYDGSNYSYDINGRLVAPGSGNGKRVIPYSNSIFRTGSILSESLLLQARYVSNGTYTTKLKLGQSNEKTVIKNNRNKSANFALSQDVVVRNLSINGSFTHTGERFSNSNRNGFLNRAYQNSLLTPVSFDNSQGYLLANDQRRYSNEADNPFFVLEDNGNFFSNSHNIASLAIEEKFNNIKIKIVQSLDKMRENADENYKPATAFFPNGISVNRKKTDANYFLNGRGTIDIRYGGYRFRSTATLNYSFANATSRIVYTNAANGYMRSSHDLNINYFTTVNANNIDAGIRVGNKFYASSSSLQNDFFLPEASGYILLNNIFNAGGLHFKLASNWVKFNSELPVSTSFSQYELTSLSANRAFQFFPVNEIKSFSDLLPVRHKEWTLRGELTYKNKISLSAEVFSRKTNDDIFPLYQNRELILKNLADHRKNGVELLLSSVLGGRKLMTNHSVSLTTYNDVVTSVESGFNFTAVAGLSNVYKAIVNGERLGVIVGSRFLRDAQNNIIIGNNGFPLVDPNHSVVGDPTPDFILKTNNSISWKWFSFSLDCEWKNGGDMWNGTQAVLDYFGRSKTSALLRNTTGYIFTGLLSDGHANNIPVNFYDPNLPLEENRWVRYGYPGVAEEYIQKADYVRINNLALGYKLSLKKYIQSLSFTLNAGNLLIWSAYKGADQNQLFYDQSNGNGLDFFNIPSAKSFGINVSIQF